MNEKDKQSDARTKPHIRLLVLPSPSLFAPHKMFRA